MRTGRRETGLAVALALSVGLPALALAACGGAGDASDGARANGASAAAAGSAGAASQGAAGNEISASDTALAGMAEELLPELERRSGLEARRPPRLARRSRAELEAFLNDELAEQLPPDEAEALGATYARLGLVPDTLDLEATLRELYLEQVVGYYDPEADTLFVLEDVPMAEARMVLVHELVHALQDQHVDLDSLTDALREQNDRSAAARAAIEGQATLVMAEWAVARSTGSDVDLTAMPGIAEKFAEVAAGGAAENMPSFAAAPRVVRETLTFPYVGGLGYMQALWSRTEGRPAPFGPRLPASTEQVIHPERALGDDPTDVTFPAPPPEGWKEAYASTLGELETRIFLSVHLGADSTAREAASGWDGDRVRLLASGEREALAWVSVWDSPGQADAFARAARRAYGARYGSGAGRRVTVERVGVGGRPGVRVLDRPAGVPASSLRPAARVQLSAGGAGSSPGGT